MTIVYTVTNQISGKQYVGITRQKLSTRWIQHCHGQASCMPIVRAIKKYGRDNFEISVLEECADGVLGEREQHWIAKLDTFKNGYNATEGGDGGIKGWKHTEDAKQRMSKARMGNKNHNYGKNWFVGHTEESKRKISQANSGNKNGMYGKKHSLDVRKKITQSQYKKVCQYTSEGLFIAEYDSMQEAAKFVDGKSQSISRCCRNIKKHHRGYRWSYAKTKNKGLNG